MLIGAVIVAVAIIVTAIVVDKRRVPNPPHASAGQDAPFDASAAASQTAHRPWSGGGGI